MVSRPFTATRAPTDGVSTWPDTATDWHAAFDQVVFRDVASFRGSGFRSFAAVDGASFGGGLQLDDTDEKTANQTFKTELAAALPQGKETGEDRLRQLERSPIAACLLLIPAFVPVLSVVALLGILSGGRMTGVPGYVALFISHIALHYPVFQFICISLIATIPERHVEWQRECS